VAKWVAKSTSVLKPLVSYRYLLVGGLIAV